MALRKFRSDELFMSNQEAWQVLVFFFGGNAGSVPGWLTDNDRSFAQALLIEAIDKSYLMSWVEALFSSAMKVNPSIKGILKALAKKAVRDWWNGQPPPNLENAKIYQSVHDQLWRAWKSPWQIRLQTGEDVY